MASQACIPRFRPRTMNCAEKSLWKEDRCVHGWYKAKPLVSWMSNQTVLSIASIVGWVEARMTQGRLLYLAKSFCKWTVWGQKG